jgi:hypothetical protein
MGEVYRIRLEENGEPIKGSFFFEEVTRVCLKGVLVCAIYNPSCAESSLRGTAYSEERLFISCNTGIFILSSNPFEGHAVNPQLVLNENCKPSSKDVSQAPFHQGTILR